MMVYSESTKRDLLHQWVALSFDFSWWFKLKQSELQMLNAVCDWLVRRSTNLTSCLFEQEAVTQYSMSRAEITGELVGGGSSVVKDQGWKPKGRRFKAQKEFEFRIGGLLISTHIIEPLSKTSVAWDILLTYKRF